MGEIGKRGLVARCPYCEASGDLLYWDQENDICSCSRCGWTNGPNYQLIYKRLFEKLCVEFRHYGPEDKFNKEFYLTATEKIMLKLQQEVL